MSRGGEKWDGEPDRGVDGEMKQWKRGRQLRPRKDRAAAPAYQLFHKSSARISINSNDKCGPLWQRLINSVRGELARARIQIIQCHRLEQVLRGSVLSPIMFWNYYCSFTCNGAVRAFVHYCLV